MTDYTNSYGAASKDSGNDIILAADISAQFDLIVTMSGTKANKVASPTVDYMVLMDAGGDLKTGGQTIAELLADTPLTGAPTLGGTNLVDAFPSGTNMVFYQTAAPTGWTRNVDAALNDHALRIMTSGTWAIGSHGTTAFSTQFAQAFASETFQLLATHLPAHDHGSAGAHTHDVTAKSGSGVATAIEVRNDVTNVADVTDAAQSAGAHTHTSVGGDTAHGHDVNLGVKYLDMIIASKD